MGHPPGARLLPADPPDEVLAAAVARVVAVADRRWPSELAALLRGTGEQRADRRRPAQLCATAWVFDDEQRQILLVAHDRLGWACPGGHVEGVESPWAAACRELHEETGLVADPGGRTGAPGAPAPLTVTCADMADSAAGPAHRHWSIGYRLTPVEPGAAPAHGARWWPVDALPDRRPDDLVPTLRALGFAAG
ncbi:MAG: NUDIX domain-containing protein [Acidimicrobiia bacterium]